MASDILWDETGWVCIDCLVFHANGDLPDNEIEAGELLHDITKNLDGYRVTLGHSRELHDCKSNFTITPLYGEADDWQEMIKGEPVEVYADTASDALNLADVWEREPRGYQVVAHDLTTLPEQGGECDCDVETFASHDCVSCDRNIAGEWHAATLWKVVEDAAQ